MEDKKEAGGIMSKFVEQITKDLELDLEKIWQPYSRDNPLENTLAYLKKEADMRDIPQAVLELAIFQIFSDVQTGKLRPSTTKCSCGCGIDKSGTDFTHMILRRMVELHKETVLKQAKIMQNKLNRMLKKKANKTFEKHIRNTKMGFFKRTWFELTRRR